MLNDNVKNILLAIFAAWIIFDLGSALLYSRQYPDAAKQYGGLFSQWPSWLVIGLAIAAGFGAWYGLNMKK